MLMLAAQVLGMAALPVVAYGVANHFANDDGVRVIAAGVGLELAALLLAVML
jgi:hypothetical protein